MKNLMKIASSALITLLILFTFSCNNKQGRKLSYKNLNIRSTQTLCNDVMKLGPDLMMNIKSYDTLLIELRQHKRVGIVIDSISGKTIDANRRYLRMLGYSLKEIKFLAYQQLTPEKWHEMERKLFEKVMKTGYSGIYEKEYIRKDSTVFSIETEAWLIMNNKNKPARLLSLVWKAPNKESRK